jgi:hypothetical protein
VAEAPDLEAALDMDLDELDTLLDSQSVKLGMRTLVISDRDDKNRNPRVTGISWGQDADAQPDPVRMLASFDANLAVLRQQAAAEPMEVEQKQTVHFKVQVEDDDPIEEAIRFQWISTGGDFEGLREQVQKWECPEYQEPDADKGEADQRGQDDADPRTDPNLHPIWVIVRDSGIAGQLGQSWAEFYVRVLPSADE